MSREERLDADLKSFEAQLASLNPRTDRLDREQLMFQAGRQSIRTSRVLPWVWPAACGLSTTAAMVMLVALLMQPEPQVVVKYVEVPAKADTQEPGPDQEWEETLTEPETGSSLMATVGLDSAAHRWRGKSLYWQRVERALNREPDWPTGPVSASEAPPATAPVPYRELLDRMLKEPASNGSSSDRSSDDFSILLNPGVHS